jgi:hypothetical protein
VLGIVLVVAGLLQVNQPASFGWFASAPLVEGTFMRFPSPLVALPLAAAVVLAVGVVLVAGWVGFRLGRRPPLIAEDA